MIPTSVEPERIVDNIDAFDFRLTDDELAAIDALETGVRGGPEPADATLGAFGEATRMREAGRAGRRAWRAAIASAHG